MAALGVTLVFTALCVARAAAQEPKIRVEVNLVNLLASVTDPGGRPVPDLPREAFEVLEEGVPQKIELFEADTLQPLDLALMIDSSLSTLAELAFEREAGARFIGKVVRPADRLAVFQISEGVTQLAGFSANVSELQAAVRGIEPGTSTSLYDAIFLGAQVLERRPAGRRRVIVLVTDAGETTSNSTFEQARREAVRSDALLYTILIRVVKTESGRNTAGEHALLAITDATGGVMLTADTPEQLDDMFGRIDRELRTQYRLGYYPAPRPPARSHRRIELRLKCSAVIPACAAAGEQQGSNAARGFTLRYRKGYFTADAN